MQTLELVIMFAALLALVVAGSVCLHKFRPSRWTLMTVGMLAVVFVVRYLLTTPVFAHANFHATTLMDEAWLNPLQSVRNYGPFSIFVQGCVMRLFGADLAVLAFFNQLVSVTALAAMADLAKRWTKSTAAGICVIAAGAFNPVWMRLGASEDAHGIAILLVWIAFATMDRFARTQRRVFLTVSTACAVLMLLTKQIMFAFAPFVPLIGLCRMQSRSPRIRALWMSSGVIAGVLVLRLVSSFLQPSQWFHIQSIVSRMAKDGALGYLLMHHPLLDVTRFAIHLLPCGLVGLVWLFHSSRSGRLWVLLAVVAFLASAWTYEGDRVAFMFRLPVLSIGLYNAGVGMWVVTCWIGEKLAGKDRRHNVVRVVSLALGIILLLLAPAWQRGWKILDQIGPQEREYAFIRDMRRFLPREVVVVVPETSITEPSYRFPGHLLAEAGIQALYFWPSDARLSRIQPEVPVLFLRGIFCHAYSLQEVLGLKSPNQLLMTDQWPYGIKKALTGRYPVPDQERWICRCLLRGAKPVGFSRKISTRYADPPFATYGRASIELQFYVLDRAVLAGSSP